MASDLLHPESEILERVIAPNNPDFTPEAARSLLQLRFSAEDISRMNELAAKARAGALTDDEERMLEGFRFVGAMIDLLHSKARLSLKRTSVDER
jgi:uncharacterized protein YnzC (UPF0291/DUF896 family)